MFVCLWYRRSVISYGSYKGRLCVVHNWSDCPLKPWVCYQHSAAYSPLLTPIGDEGKRYSVRNRTIEVEVFVVGRNGMLKSMQSILSLPSAVALLCVRIYLGILILILIFVYIILILYTLQMNQMNRIDLRKQYSSCPPSAPVIVPAFMWPS